MKNSQDSKQKTKQFNLKMGKRPEYIFFPRKYGDRKQARKKMLYIINHQGNANQDHNEISSHSFQNGYYQKD